MQHAKLSKNVEHMVNALSYVNWSRLFCIMATDNVIIDQITSLETIYSPSQEECGHTHCSAHVCSLRLTVITYIPTWEEIKTVGGYGGLLIQCVFLKSLLEALLCVYITMEALVYFALYNDFNDYDFSSWLTTTYPTFSSF